jgi:hypothetical protein
VIDADMVFRCYDTGVCTNLKGGQCWLQPTCTTSALGQGIFFIDPRLLAAQQHSLVQIQFSLMLILCCGPGAGAGVGVLLV